MLFPQVVHAAGVLASGAIGAPSSVRGSAFGGAPPWPGYASDPSPFFSAAGGPLVDMAVYPLAAIAGLIGPVRRVTAPSTRTRDSFTVEDGPAAGRRVPVEVDDNWQLMLELAGGCLAFVEANFCAHATASPELEIRGETGTLALSLLDVVRAGAPVQPGRMARDARAARARGRARITCSASSSWSTPSPPARASRSRPSARSTCSP